MRITGIIAEYNPFHNGHLFLVQAARLAGADAVAVVMGGNWLQRGEPALFPKEVRARAALRCGVDLVLELPLPYAAAPARQFAGGGVAALASLPGLDTLAFGCESGGIPPLLRCVQALDHPALDGELRRLMGAGLPYAAARQQAVAALAGEEAAAPLSRPNDTLAVQYLQALTALPGREIRPLAVPRQGAGHNSAAPSCPAPGEGGPPTASASWIRGRLVAGDWQGAAGFLPAASLRTLEEAARAGRMANPARLELPLLAVLRRMSREEFARLPDLSEGLEHRLWGAVRQGKSLSELLALAGTKRYPTARLRRILLAAYLGIPAGADRRPLPYLRVLGMTPRGAEALAVCRRAGMALPVSHSLSHLKGLGGEAGALAELEARAGDLYGLLYPVPECCGGEYRLPLVKEGVL